VKRQTTRRSFLKQTALAGVGVWVSGRSLHSQSKSPNEKLNIAVIGCGGKGHSDTQCVATENIVALCDVDANNAGGCFKEFPNAKKYTDFRKMLDAEKSLDAVVVATPDHTHAPASVMAMKLGKHVYCQKPLTHSVFEARTMRETAAKMKVVTQMGNQGSAEPGLRRAVEIIQAGALGPVRQVHVWSNRPIWPQGIDRPEGSKPVPSTLDWDLWLSAAPDRPYNDGYCPFNWRGWQDFGTGALGDMACHTANMPFRALKLEYPVSIEAESSGINKETYPKWSRIRFEFPARGDMPALSFFWYDGGQKPAPEVTGNLDLATKVEGSKKKKKVEVLKAGDVPGSGCLIVGDKAALFSPDDYGAAFRIFPEDDFKDYKGPPETIPRLDMKGGTDQVHHQEWIRAIKQGGKPYSSFDYAALLTETILLGNIALRTGKKLDWDGPNMKAKNCPEAEQFIRREYRKGYTL
jgi:predicted dehydrogenase